MTAIQVKATQGGQLRYRVVREISNYSTYEVVPLTRWCASVEGAKKAFRKVLR